MNTSIPPQAASSSSSTDSDTNQLGGRSRGTTIESSTFPVRLIQVQPTTRTASSTIPRYPIMATKSPSDLSFSGELPGNAYRPATLTRIAQFSTCSTRNAMRLA